MVQRIFIPKIRYDILIFIITVTLVIIGLCMVYSASGIWAFKKSNEQDTYLLFKGQLLAAFIGLAGLLIMRNLNYKILSDPIVRIGLISLAILLLILVVTYMEVESKGASRSIKLGWLSCQPSEFVKFIAIIYLADFLRRKPLSKNNFILRFLPLLIILGTIICLILSQPHLGMGLLIITTFLLVLWVMNMKIVDLILLSIILGEVAMLFLTPHQIDRLFVANSHYQSLQSEIALGSGGLFGVGWGRSLQKLLYLPEAYTEFIFSIIGEEFGWIGGVGILSLFFGFAYCGISISRLQTDLFGSLLAFGLTVIIILQVCINIGMSIGCLPITGLPLPFVSFGKSELVANMMIVGILMNIHRGNRG